MRSFFHGLFAMLLVVAPAMAAGDTEAIARRIEGKLMSPCCMANTVAVHQSGASYEARREIREMLAAGLNEAQILDHYVERYGSQILAMPRAEGFSLTPYLSPFLLMLLASVAIAFAIRRWRAAERGNAPPAVQPVPAGPWAERLQHELDDLD